MTDREYNGWTNWDTWAFALWVDNTETSYRVRMGLCQTVAESDRDREDMDGVLAKVLRDNADDLLLVSGSTDTHDISKINFAEIAEHWMEDVEDLIPDSRRGEGLVSLSKAALACSSSCVCPADVGGFFSTHHKD